ncbi:MAG: hypothetical protein BWZ10_00269 [candidate division BRC1 bacterium ADurb.BinA364]|nr:MAG: hypothetical protein BWZ10_00269 [candidate division BRC1 bacterium ADurb.BinA364]
MRRVADDARLVEDLKKALVRLANLQQVQRLEGGAPQPLVLEILDGGARVVGPAGHDVLHMAAQRGLDRRFVLLPGPNQLRHDANDPEQPLFVGCLHHALDALVVSLVARFQVLQGAQLVQRLAQNALDLLGFGAHRADPLLGLRVGFLQRFKFVRTRLQRLLGFAALSLQFSGAAFQGVEALARFLGLAVPRFDLLVQALDQFAAEARGVVGRRLAFAQILQFGPQRIEPLDDAFAPGLDLVEFGLGFGERLAGFGQPLLEFGQFGAGAADFVRRRDLLARIRRVLAAQGVLAAAGLGDPFAQHGDLVLLAFDAASRLEQLPAFVGQSRGERGFGFMGLFLRRLEIGDARGQRRQTVAQIFVRAGQFGQARLHRFVALGKQNALDSLRARLIALVALRLRGLAFQAVGLALDLADQVGQAQKVRLGALELAQSLGAADFVFGNPRRFLEQIAALRRLGVDDRIDLALFQNRIAVGADSGVDEQIRNVAQPAGRLVQQILALAVGEEAARDRHLGKIDRQSAILVVDGQRDLGQALRLERRAAAENDVRHARTAQTAGALLAQDPANGVENIAFSATVGSDNDRNARLKLQRGFRAKGFESLQFEPFEKHRANHPRRRPPAGRSRFPR